MYLILQFEIYTRAYSVGEMSSLGEGLARRKATVPKGYVHCSHSNPGYHCCIGTCSSATASLRSEQSPLSWQQLEVPLPAPERPGQAPAGRPRGDAAARVTAVTGLARPFRAAWAFGTPRRDRLAQPADPGRMVEIGRRWARSAGARTHGSDFPRAH